MMMSRSFVLAGAVVFFAAAALASMPGASDGPGIRYATDAYPGFDREGEIGLSAKKKPSWFKWGTGPEKENAADQLAYARACVSNGSWRAARKGYDAVVRHWPSSPEAPVAQQALADLYLDHYQECQNAFVEYRYLLDYYSSQCDFDAIAYRLYEMAKMMREEGKRFMFFRFANTTDVRKAFESVVLRAPGAAYAPEAMLTVAELFEEDDEYARAIQVYENLRILYPKTPEAKVARRREGGARMHELRAHEYNRSRCQDTIDFMKLALAAAPEPDDRAAYEAWRAEAEQLIENEAFEAARFYDSRTRTRRSAVSAYERFLSEYPAGAHAEAARARLAELEAEDAK